jgi:redox-sensitive bicupin YhaK (pirin superfamily)
MVEKNRVAAEECSALGASGQTIESFPNSEVQLGDLTVSRALPVRNRRLVGPWCFLDRFGPLTFAAGKPMDVAPHPHIGLQTVTWLLDGEILHDDSLGCEAVARPGAVNVMTAGRGVAHTEQTPPNNSGRLSGVQLWAALPALHRDIEPFFASHTHVPVAEERGGLVRVFAGSLAGVTSPARHFSEIVGGDVEIRAGESVELELNPAYEHAVLVLSGDCSVENQPLSEGLLHYLGARRAGICFRSQRSARILLIGGPPFAEKILMWWNFVARTPQEIAQARADWEDHLRFGEVRAYHGPRLAAPSLIRFARPDPMS